MISKVTKGHNAYPLIRYLFLEGKAGERGLKSDHSDAHLVAAWDDVAVLEPRVAEGADGVRRRDVTALAELLDQPVKFSGREHKAPTMWHLSLSNAPGDKSLSDEQWATVVRDVMERTGIAKPGDEDACRWVAVRHADDHVHVAATLIRPSGKRAWLKNDFLALRDVCREAEKRYGITVTAKADSTAAVRPQRAEQEKTTREGWKEPARTFLRRQVRTAAATATTSNDFFATLQACGVLIKQRESNLVPGRITGYAVASSRHVGADGKPIYYSGGKLAPDLTLPKLSARWREATGSSNAEEKDCPQFKTGASTETPNRKVEAEQRNQAWQDINNLITASREKLDKEAATAGASAAWAAADLAASLADVAPLAAHKRIADLIERAALHPNRRTPPPHPAGKNLRTAAVLLASMQVVKHHETEQLLALLAQLQLLAEAVARMRETQEQAAQATAARQAAEALRDHIMAKAPQPKTAAGQQWWQAYEQLNQYENEQQPAHHGGPGRGR